MGFWITKHAIGIKIGCLCIAFYAVIDEIPNWCLLAVYIHHTKDDFRPFKAWVKRWTLE